MDSATAHAPGGAAAAADAAMERLLPLQPDVVATSPQAAPSQPESQGGLTDKQLETLRAQRRLFQQQSELLLQLIKRQQDLTGARATSRSLACGARCATRLPWLTPWLRDAGVNPLKGVLKETVQRSAELRVRPRSAGVACAPLVMPLTRLATARRARNTRGTRCQRRLSAS